MLFFSPVFFLLCFVFSSCGLQRETGEQDSQGKGGKDAGARPPGWQVPELSERQKSQFRHFGYVNLEAPGEIRETRATEIIGAGYTLMMQRASQVQDAEPGIKLSWIKNREAVGSTINALVLEAQTPPGASVSANPSDVPANHPNATGLFSLMMQFEDWKIAVLRQLIPPTEGTLALEIGQMHLAPTKGPDAAAESALSPNQLLGEDILDPIAAAALYAGEKSAATIEVEYYGSDPAPAFDPRYVAPKGQVLFIDGSTPFQPPGPSHLDIRSFWSFSFDSTNPQSTGCMYP